MRLTSLIAAAIAATFVTAVHAEPVVLKAAYLFDSKSGQLTQGGTLVVDGEKIVSVGGAAPANAKVVDLRAMARRMDNFPIKGRDVARAGRDELLAAFRSLNG